MRRLIPRQAWNIYDDASSPFSFSCASLRTLGVFTVRPSNSDAFSDSIYAFAEGYLPTASRVRPTPTATPLTCLSQPPRVDSGEIDSTKPPQLFLIYLPPCYNENASQRYPVLYLLHGQTYIDDQWVRLGAPQAANQLILSGQVPPFIMVFPDDRYWNLPEESGFGDRVVNVIIPYIDFNYRALADRQDRAIGGLSLGGGWAHASWIDALRSIRLRGFAFASHPRGRWALYRRLDQSCSSRILATHLDQRRRPDRGLGDIMQFESLLSEYQVPHEWHMYTGDHSEMYWSAHVTEYLQWYAEGWESSP